MNTGTKEKYEKEMEMIEIQDKEKKLTKVFQE